MYSMCVYRQKSIMVLLKALLCFSVRERGKPYTLVMWVCEGPLEWEVRPPSIYVRYQPCSDFNTWIMYIWQQGQQVFTTSAAELTECGGN